MQLESSASDSWRLVRIATSLIRPLGMAALVFGAIAMSGYIVSQEELYRPLAGGAATHPLTALVISAIGIALFSNVQGRVQVTLQRLFAVIALLASACKIVDVVTDVELTTYLIPFQQVILEELAAGKDNYMGGNTAMMLFSLAVAILLHTFRYSVLSQIVASVAASIPLISFLGYAYGVNNFYGHMSMLTATAGLALSIATIGLTANQGVARALLSPHIAGRIARYQVAASYLIPSLMGFLVIKSIVNNEASVFGMFVIAICWFILIMVSLSAFFIEAVDEKRRHHERELELRAMTDELTRIPNRRAFIERAHLELDRIERTKASLWLLMVDIDNFKHINDEAGHATGDIVLRRVAQAMTASIRQIDVVGRLGGEEFGLLLPDTPLDGARRVAESVRRNIELLRINEWTDDHGPVTVSVGVAVASSRETFQNLLDKADEALYRSKANGRNRVSFHSLEEL